MEGINGIPKTIGRYYKRRWNYQQKPFSNKESKHKDHLKNSFNSQKNRKREKTMRDLELGTRGYTWIQGDSNLTSLGSL